MRMNTMIHVEGDMGQSEKAYPGNVYFKLKFQRFGNYKM